MPGADQSAIGALLAFAQHRRGLEDLLARMRQALALRQKSEHALPQRRAHHAEPAGERLARRLRRSRQQPRKSMPVIAGEQLIPAVPRQCDGDVLAGQLRQKIGRDLRGIGERLVIDRRQRRDHALDLFRRDIELGVLGAEMLGDRLGVRRLVIALLSEADGIGPHRGIAPRPHHGRDGGRVDPAGEKCAERHIRDQSPLHRIAKQRFQRIGRFGGAEIERRRPAPRRDIHEAPIGPDIGLAVGLDADAGSRRKLVDAAIDRMRRRHIGEAEIRGERVEIDLGAPLGQRLERLQLGGEHHAPVLPAPIERLDAEPVAHQAEPALLAVEHGEGEHADQAARRSRARPMRRLPRR